MRRGILRVLIVEDTPERQEILASLFKEHAWVLAHTAARAIRLLEAYEFDLISLDYDLAGKERGDVVAAAIPGSRSEGAQVIVHSMNAQGAERIARIIPRAIIVPLSKITRNNATFKRIRQELRHGTTIDWGRVLAQKEQ